MPLFAILYEPGPAWQPGRAITEQPLEQHTAYQRQLYGNGRSLFAGPFLDEPSGGVAVVRAASEAEAGTIAAQDPAVVEGIMVARVRPWFAMVGREAAGNVAVIRKLFAAVASRDQPNDVGEQRAAYEQIYDPEVTIHEAATLPYGGEYRGHKGVAQHALAFRATWDALQTDEDRPLDPKFFGDGDRVVVLWKLRARDPNTDERFSMPVVSVYTLRNKTILESQMSHFDAAATRAFCDRVAARATPAASGPGDALAFARAVLAAQPFSRLIGAELIAFAPEATELQLRITDRLKQQSGFVHGGVLSYLADNALTFAGGSVLGTEVVTAEMKINYCRPAVGERLVARSRVLSSGETQAVVRCDVFVVEGGEERLCAAAQGTVVTARRK